MTTIRVKKDERYFSASNEPFNDTRLSWESRGLMGYLLSKPNDWQVRMTDLDKQGPAGEHKLRRMLAELRKAGYMNRIRVVREGHKFDWITEVYESPSQNPRPASWGFSTSGSSTSGELPDIGSTDLPSTEEKIEKDDAQIFQALEKLMGALNSSIPRLVDTWLEKHPLEKILEAIEVAREKGARSEKYVDKILIGWEANGYPKTREEQVQAAKTRAPARSAGESPAPTVSQGVSVAQSWLAKKEQEMQHGRT